MNKKITIIVLCVIFCVSIMIAGAMGSSGDSSEEDYDSAYYVDSKNNIISRIAKIGDNCCYYVVDIVLDGISMIVSLVIGE
jgi:hypothetical protein